ncbi:MAG: dienelactone hydrolase family protein [Deltaproteobacteria bacterium]|nr:dienelactone hydrolase family protein [Sandaracinaceae bacterium]MCX7807864.1 dienelactone hydrolase family protein [Deltaproteobacteria bacterium]MDW8245790.1 dienelactone hydrolase family protein [Sandaracinaceae bacterium]
MPAETITLYAQGKAFQAALATPKGVDSSPGVVVIHEWWGLNDNIRRMAERFASEGFTAIAPDLYGGVVTSDPNEAARLMQSLDTEHALTLIRASVEELARRTGRKVGVTGFCMGGALSFAAAASIDGLACAVPFYGIPKDEYFDAAKMRCPIQAHFAKEDAWARADRAQALAEAIRARGGVMELYVYDAGHAFMREGDPSVYKEEAAKVAWERAIAFLRKHLLG